MPCSCKLVFVEYQCAIYFFKPPEELFFEVFINSHKAWLSTEFGQIFKAA